MLASAWDVAQLVKNIDPDWDALLAGNENDDRRGATKILMGAISIHAHESQRPEVSANTMTNFAPNYRRLLAHHKEAPVPVMTSRAQVDGSGTTVTTNLDGLP